MPKKPLPTLKSESDTAFTRKPHAYQLKGVEWLVSHGGAGLFVDPGLGKTSMVLKAWDVILKAKVGRRMLVVAPLRVAHNVWPAEPKEWAGSAWDSISKLKIVVLHGGKKDLLINEPADIYVINFEGFTGWLLKKHPEFLDKIDTLCVDESSKLRNTRTLRWRTLKPLLPRFKRRWILTGSPNPRSYMDLFGQCYVVDLGHALGRFITHFRAIYFTPLDRNGWQWALKSGAAELIQQQIAPYIFRLDAEDHIKMPKLITNTIRIDLPKKARRVYDEMEEEMIVELGAKVVTAASAGAASMKCSQIANGGLYFGPEENSPSGKRTWNDLHLEKVNAVKELVDELQGSPALVVYEYEHDLKRLKAALQDDYQPPPHIGGGVGTAESTRLIAAWNRDQLPVLLVHPSTISHGLNMQFSVGHTIIWHSLTTDFEAFDQLNRRLRRQGSQHDHIMVHFVVANDTVDEAKLRNLKRKEKSQTDFLAALKAYCAERDRRAL